MRLAGAEELNAVRGSQGSGSTMAADALKVNGEVFTFFSLVSSQFRHLDLYCAACHHFSGRGDKVARFFLTFLQAYHNRTIPK